jgi:hypothetical protein
MLMLSALAACGPNPEPKKQPTPAITATVPDVAASVITSEEAMVAVMRGHPHSIQVCYDTGLNGYFLQYPPRKEGATDDVMYGWYFLQKVQYFRASNNTWFIANQPEVNYASVYPDVAGLPCKMQ